MRFLDLVVPNYGLNDMMNECENDSIIMDTMDGQSYKIKPKLLLRFG